MIPGEPAASHLGPKMEGPSVVASPANPLATSPSVNHPPKQEQDDLDDFILELDETEINGADNNAESLDLKNDERVSKSVDENCISKSEAHVTCKIDEKEAEPSSCDPSDAESKISAIGDKAPPFQEETMTVNIPETCKKETSLSAIPASENGEEAAAVTSNGEATVASNECKSEDISQEIEDNFESMDKELDSLLKSDNDNLPQCTEVESERKIAKELDNEELIVPKKDVNEEIDDEPEIKHEKMDSSEQIELSEQLESSELIESSELSIDIKEEIPLEIPLDNSPSNLNKEFSINTNNDSKEKTENSKTLDALEEAMEVSCNGIDEDSTDVIEPISETTQGNSSQNTAALLGDKPSDTRLGEKPSDAEDSNVESGKENRNKRMAEMDRKRNVKKIKISADDLPNGVHENVPNGLLDDDENSQFAYDSGKSSDNSGDATMSESSLDDTSNDSFPDKNSWKKKQSRTKFSSTASKSAVLDKDLSSANPEIYQKARADLGASPFKDSRTLTVDGNMMEELVMMKVVEFLTVGSQNDKRPLDNAGLYKKCKIQEDKMHSLQKRIHDLTKQVEDCKHIIKKLIEEKVSAQPWTNHVTPLRVTRSVGLQVCTVGSVNITNSRVKDMETVKQLLTTPKQDPQESSKDNKEDVIFVGEQSSGTKKENESSTSSAKGTAVRSSLTSGDKKTPELDRTVTSTAQNKSTFPPARATNPAKISASSTPDSSSGKKDPATIAVEKKSQPKVAACIDLTDTDDIPARPEALRPSAPRVLSASKSAPASGALSVKPPAALFPGDRMGKPLPQSNGFKTSSGSLRSSPASGFSSPSTGSGVSSNSPSGISTSSSKLSNNMSYAGADLHTSYEHLPKLPVTPTYPSEVPRPPRPVLRIGRNTTANSGKQGIMLSWNFELGLDVSDITEYQLYAFQENKGPEKSQDNWKKVGDIKALPLPMACFLTQFVEGHKYHFVVRAIDNRNRVGEFSLPGSIILNPNTKEMKDKESPKTSSSAPPTNGA